jgi:hypothetical protein
MPRRILLVVPAAIVSGAFGAVLLACSVAVSPVAWRQRAEIALSLAPRDAR